MKAVHALLLAVFLSFVSLAGFAAPININKADAPALANALVGVGPKAAEAIVSYRTQHGDFKSVDELSKVKGIGAKTVEKNRDRMTVGTPPN